MLRGGAGLAALVALSGCSSGTDGSDGSDDGEGDVDGSTAAGDGTGVATASPVPTTAPPTTARTPTPAPGVDHATRFRGFLESEGVAVRELREEGPIVTLRYATESTSYQAVSRGIGRIAGGFFRGVRDGWTVTRLEATVTDATGAPLATWFARTEWYREYRAGEITADELSLRVLRTVERTGTAGTGTPTAGTNG